ncbi:right-handed parallel beta-helix repeat-containing protein [Amycolatopsis sp. NPDC026612]|uniref:right-handed parallel beta-helix repeat-containing protein n=1 Tax=Amycolatopsis sp. NPDC026612 TaxID=3155466 RepID=UPI0033CC0CB1
MRRRVKAAMFATGLALAATGVLVTPATSAPQQVVHVAPNGDDTHDGTSDAQSVRTLQRAQQLVRGLIPGMTGDISVSLAGGTYALSAPLRLTAADSGANGHRVVWTAAPGARPVVSGGVPITGWKVADSGKNIWSAPAPATLRTRQLYINGARVPRATGTLPVTLTRITGGYTTSSAAMDNWRNPKDIDFVYTGGLGAWTQPRCPVSTISPTTIKMAQPCWDNSTKRVMRTDDSGRTVELVGRQAITELPTAVENAYELLSAGEWYLDNAAHTVFYVPKPGEDITKETVTAPALETLVSGIGTASAPVHDITFSGLQFSYATWNFPSTPEGFSEIQANYTLTGAHGFDQQGLCQFVDSGQCPYGNWTKEPGNVSFAYDKNISFTRDAFAHLGAAGLDLGTGSQNDLVQGNVFTDISGNGLELGGVDITLPTAAAQHTNGNRLLDNHVFATSVEYAGGIGMDIGYTEHTTVSHNQIDHVPYSGISIGWGGWPDKVKIKAEPNYSNNNTLSDNLIFDHMQLLADGAGIYTNGNTGPDMAGGEKVTGNVIHDQKGAGKAVYTDNGAGNITITGNGLYNADLAWGSKHTDYTLNKGTYDPLDIENNYWENGSADYNQKSVVIRDNHAITDASGIPASIRTNAGLEATYADVLGWTPAG